MAIDKRLIGEIANHIVGIRALNPNILINKYKITRGKLDSIIEIFIEIGIVEFVSFTEPYKVIPQTKDELSILLTGVYDIIDRRAKQTPAKLKVKSIDDLYSDPLKEIKEALIRIESKIDSIEVPAKNMRFYKRFNNRH